MRGSPVDPDRERLFRELLVWFLFIFALTLGVVAFCAPARALDSSVRRGLRAEPSEVQVTDRLSCLVLQIRETISAYADSEILATQALRIIDRVVACYSRLELHSTDLSVIQEQPLAWETLRDVKEAEGTWRKACEELKRADSGTTPHRGEKG